MPEEQRPLYKVREWRESFESAESRRVRHTRWLPVPNRHDGKGFRRVAALPNSVSVFCAWQLMLEVASKMPERGVLADEDGPLNASDLAFMTGFPSEIFDEAFAALTNPQIAWLECDQAVPVSVPEPSPVALLGVAGQDTDAPSENTAHREGEDRTRQDNEGPPGKGTRVPQPFIITPEMAEWAATNTPGLNLEKEAQEFVDYWKALPGRGGLKSDWQATFRNSLRRSYDRKRGRGPAGPDDGVDSVTSELEERKRRRERQQQNDDAID